MSSLNDAATYGHVTSVVLSSGDAVRLTGCCTKVRLYRLLRSGLVSMAPEHVYDPAPRGKYQLRGE